MGKVIGFVNQKGGVAKTTSSTNMAYILANDYHKKVLFIDFDGQHNGTDSFGLVDKLNENISENEEPILIDDLDNTIVDIINYIITDEMDKIPKDRSEYIYNLKGVDVIPCNSELSMLENNLVNVEFQRETILKRFVNTLKDDYDYIIMDSLPKLGLQMINLLFACDEVIIPTHCAKKAISGFTDLIKTINKVKKNGNENLTVKGILITMANESTNAFNFIKDQIKNNYGEYKIYNSVIPFVKKFEEGDLLGKLWAEYLPKHKASIRYKEFVMEYLNQ